ncbi:MAG: endonuclease/exonuclease/phosphatase family protein [Saprospiraceae bacterium]|nr:endonuclease/exonuclease/phosphatase family protein [Saprospiraceae bacterium]
MAKNSKNSTASTPVKVLKFTWKWTFRLLLLFVLYVVICLIHGTVTDFRPEEILPTDQVKIASSKQIDKAELTFWNWNIGYCGLGKESNFFFDNGGFFFSGGKMVRPSQKLVEKNLKSVQRFIQENTEADFYLLQEVDRNSKRSYFINQLEAIQGSLPKYNSSFAINFKCPRVPLPVCEPWNVMGKMNSGLATYAAYQADSVARHQFPGEYGWPDRIFHLDRCMAVHRYPTKQADGKELIVINTHNSAYDGGVLKKQEMTYFKKFVLNEYEKGNYIIVGGDWNQCPPEYAFDALAKTKGIATDSSYFPGNIAKDFLPEGWTWAYDNTVATNRKLQDTYNDKTFVTLIDYYLVSPNVKVLEVKSKDLNFEASDHQPVFLRVELLDFMPASDSISIES